jgi:hypothetical protein
MLYGDRPRQTSAAGGAKRSEFPHGAVKDWFRLYWPDLAAPMERQLTALLLRSRCFRRRSAHYTLTDASAGYQTCRCKRFERFAIACHDMGDLTTVAVATRTANSSRFRLPKQKV